MSNVTIQAEPAPLAIDPARTAVVMIDMQRDFLEPGGFGETLGNDVSLLAAAIGPARALLAGALGQFASAEIFCEMVVSCIDAADTNAPEWLDTGTGRPTRLLPGLLPCTIDSPSTSWSVARGAWTRRSRPGPRSPGSRCSTRAWH